MLLTKNILFVYLSIYLTDKSVRESTLIELLYIYKFTFSEGTRFSLIPVLHPWSFAHYAHKFQIRQHAQNLKRDQLCFLHFEFRSLFMASMENPWIVSRRMECRLAVKCELSESGCQVFVFLFSEVQIFMYCSSKTGRKI